LLATFGFSFEKEGQLAATTKADRGAQANNWIREGAIAASRETFLSRTSGLKRGHPTFDKEEKKHKDRVSKIREQFPDY
jgi:hypothetical protein